MAVVGYEVIKEYIFRIDGIPHTVKGRLLRNVAGGEHPFMWQCSHNHKTMPVSGVYYPKSLYADTVNEAEEMLIAYANSFPRMGSYSNPDY